MDPAGRHRALAGGRVTRAWLVLAALVAACASAPRDGGTVRLALNWFPESEHGGYFAADALGLFAARGVTVDIRPGGPGVPVVPRVASGEVDFGVVNADDVVAARAAGVPVVALLAPIHRSPWCVMVHAESGIERLADLRDVTLAMQAGTPYLAWLEAHAELPNVQVVPYTGSVAPFLASPRTAQQAYVFSEPIVAAAQGARVRCLSIAEIGFDPYASVLVTRDALVRERPDLVRAVTAASAEGWTRYVADPGPAHARILERNPEIGRAALDAGAAALRPLVLDQAARRDGVGSMTRERWVRLVQQMREVDVIPGLVAPEALHTAAFVPGPAP
jgi:NitT/TauT family transport system substrate-binding protein